MEVLLIGAAVLFALFIIVRLFAINTNGGGKGLDAVAHGWVQSGGFTDEKTGAYVPVFIPKGANKYAPPFQVALIDGRTLRIIHPFDFAARQEYEFDNFTDLNRAVLRYIDELKTHPY
jgi:hypothetical protein